MRALALAFLSSLTLLTGCGLASPQAASQPSTAGQSQASEPAVGAATPTAPIELPVLAERMTSSGTGIPLLIQIRQLKVDGQVMTLTWSVTNKLTSGQNKWWVNNYFDANGTGFSVDGVAIIDGANAKRYLPARTADGKCMCSQTLASVVVTVGQEVYFSAVYQAVAPAVSAVTVDVPNTGTFPNVPVAR
jgi:hypothetical protein